MPEIEKRDVTEEDIDRLLDGQGESMRVADQRRSTISPEQFHKLRALCKHDLFFLAFSVLGYTRLSVNLHGHLCTHIYNTRRDRFREFLLPRGHFKSTLITIAHTIQIILPYSKDDAACSDGEEIGWPYNLGTDCRVLIAHETAESAARFLFAITQHFTNNPLLQTLFPEAIPDRRKHRINKWELELPRETRGNPEPTIDTLGVGAKSQGRHYNYLKLDDIFGDKARDSASESETTRDWFDGIQSFFSTFGKDHFDLIGTRYSPDDIYDHAHKQYESALISYCRGVEEYVIDPELKTPKVDANGEKIKVAIFPEEFTPQQLNILRKNKRRFSAEYENNPFAGDSGFDPEWKRFFYWLKRNQLAILTGKERVVCDIRDLDICILIDPGLEKSGGFAVTGVDHVGRVYILLAMRIELKPPDLTELVFRMVMRWQPRTVAIESDFFASTFEHWWYAEMKLRGIRFSITPVFTKLRSKDDRIMGLSHYMMADKFYMNEEQKELLAEWDRVGRSRNVHIFDALGYGPEVWRLGLTPGQRALIETPTTNQDLADRDPETGYSPINYGDNDNAAALNAEEDHYSYGGR